VATVTDFGAFVELLPGRDGLVHISDLEHQRTERVEDVLKVGDMVKVKVTEVEPDGKVRASRKALLPRGGDQRGGEERGGRDRRPARRPSGGSSRPRSDSGGERRGGGDRKRAPDPDDSGGAYFRDKRRGE
jgi:polyribonucleotide nucleotidyltransferase